MSDEAKKPNLLELIDKKFLQEFQDNFSKATGFASVTIDEKGFLTEPSNFTDFCIMMKNRNISSPMCSKCDLEKRKLGFESKEPFTYTCHAGLIVFVVPIVVNNKTIALMIGGQTLTEEPKEEFYKQLAKDCGIKEIECLKKVKKVKILTKQKIESASKLLSQFANSISNTAHKNYGLQEKSKRGILLNEIITEISSTFDYNQIRKILVSKLGDAMGSDFNVLYTFNPETQKFNPVDEHSLYLTSDEIESPIGINMLEEYGWGDLARSGKMPDIFYSDIEDLKKDYNLYGTKGEEFLNKYKIKSAFYMAIRHAGNLLGMLALNYTENYKTITQEDINLIKAVASQAGIALYQANLYKETQDYAQRESLLLKLIERIRSTLDIEDTLSYICEETAKVFNVQRVAITQFSYTDVNERVKFRKEYKVNSKILGYYDLKNRNKLADWVCNEILGKKNIYVINNIQEDGAPYFVRKSFSQIGIKSIIGKTITDGKYTWGMITLSEYNNYRKWTDEDKSLLEIISNQIYIAINQAELYSKMQQQNAREKAILTNLPFMVWLKDKESKFLAVNEPFAQLCGFKADDLVGKTDYDIWPKELADGYVKDDKDVIKKRITKSVEELIQVEDKPRWHETYKTPLFDEKGEVVGTTGFARDITERMEAQKELLVRQEKIIKYAQREALLKQITEKIRSSLNIEDTLTFICEESAKLFNVKRAIIAYYIREGDQIKFPMRKEYKSSPELPVPSNNKAYDKIVEFWSKLVSTTKDIVLFDNIETSDVPDFFKDAYGQIGVKSAIGVPIKKEDYIWGSLILYAYDNVRIWTNEEKYLLEAIANQIYIAIQQAELFEKEKQSAKRETLLRKITETIRQTLNINETKRTIVTEIGKALNADRVFIVEFDVKTNSPEILDNYSEYIKPGVKSLIGYDFSSSQVEFLANIHKQKEMIIMENYEDFIKLNHLQGTETEKWIIDAEIKSGLGIPMIYGEKNIGVLAVHYTKSLFSITNEFLTFVKIISEQASIAIYQAQLYENQKLLLEREKISRNIIEILRSSIDKSIIKKLFVKNLGKFFGADRVFLAEYNSKTNTLMPIDNSSEYLSSEHEETSTNYNFTSPEFSHHVEALLEKREIRVENFEEFVKQNPGLDEKLIEHYREANTKSSYAFPIVYQDKIMGAFAIQFTHQIVKLSDEDLGRIRSICTQAGIALYHANLYEKARECEVSKQSFMKKISEKIEQPVHEIIDISTQLSQNDFEHFIEIEYLNKIIGSCNYLLELTADIDEN